MGGKNLDGTTWGITLETTGHTGIKAEGNIYKEGGGGGGWGKE